MSARANQDDKSQNLSEEEKKNQAAEQNGKAQGDQPGEEDPNKAAEKELGTTGETNAQKIANAVDAVAKLNPDLSLAEVTAIVAKAFEKEAKPETQIEKEAARLIKLASNDDDKERIYLKKDKDRKFPLSKSALDGIIVRQTYQRKTEEGDDISVPARNLNEIAIYSEHEFKRLSEPGRGFDREGITAEVWHKPGQKGTVQTEADAADKDEADED